MGITELIDKYGEAGVVFGFVLTWIIFSFQIRGMKDRIDGIETNINTRMDGMETNINTKMEAINKSIEKHDTEQRELRGLVIGIIQSIGDIKGDIGDMKGDIKLLMASQQTKAGNPPSET